MVVSALYSIYSTAQPESSHWSLIVFTIHAADSFKSASSLEDQAFNF